MYAYVTLRCLCVTTVVMEKQLVLNVVCVCMCLQPELSSMQSACAVLYCRLWPVWLYNILPHYPINDTIFVKMFLNIKCVF
jgi:hypothetical protein